MNNRINESVRGALRSLTYSLTLLLVTLPSPAAHVLFNLADFTTGSITNRQLFITPIKPPFIDGANIITGDRRTFNTGAAGSVTVSNVVYGYYLCQIAGPYIATGFTILVPGTNSSTLNANTLIQVSTNVMPGIYAYSQAQADLRFALRTNTLLYGNNTNFGNWEVSGGMTTDDGAGNKVLAIGNDPLTPHIYSFGSSLTLTIAFGGGKGALFNGNDFSPDTAGETMGAGSFSWGTAMMDNLVAKTNLTIQGITNSVTFGATNNPPAGTATPVRWISVQVSGLTNAFRLPLYQ